MISGTKVLSDLTGLSIATISRHYYAAMIRMRQEPDLDAHAAMVKIIASMDIDGTFQIRSERQGAIP